ncbi:hypothetical protein GOBAR_AA29672 [Gossypium barbadense]|uniref:Uncharacterized protein n=1 Tax=Gossypium barbadense TaxID=3634 RepID=A0A2P5WIU3_GOSBA|nr:hypothetical protein GOBAR_AA29672 [Gossypium barbadense]
MCTLARTQDFDRQITSKVNVQQMVTKQERDGGNGAAFSVYKITVSNNKNTTVKAKTETAKEIISHNTQQCSKK